MAAVRVVLPWSTCPMVPTLRCGFVRALMSYSSAVATHLVDRPSEGYATEVTLHDPQPFSSMLILEDVHQAHA